MIARLVLGIESSCDEMAAAVLEDGTRVRASVVQSQLELHRPYGGVVPELASRDHVRSVSQVVSRALDEAGIGEADLDAVAATMGPGLLGSLLVGLSFAKALAYRLGIPVVGVHHLAGRFLIIGKGTNMRSMLEAQIRDLGLGGLAQLTPYYRDMPEVMSAIDCLVLPQTGTEAIPGVVCEAHACGKPVIASRLDGIPEAFGVAGYGSLVRPGSIAGLAAPMQGWSARPRASMEAAAAA